MSGHCDDCGNTLCVCDGTPREDIAGTKEFNEKWLLVGKVYLKGLESKLSHQNQLMDAMTRISQNNAELKARLADREAQLGYATEAWRENEKKMSELVKKSHGNSGPGFNFGDKVRRQAGTMKYPADGHSFTVYFIQQNERAAGGYMYSENGEDWYAQDYLEKAITASVNT